jgi:hypothetical protein
MRQETTRTQIWKVLLCGLAGFSLAMPAVAKDMNINQGEFRVTVNAVRVVPDGNPMAGLHLDARMKNGKTVDVYIAPLSFATKYGVKVEKGDTAIIEGLMSEDLIQARSITTGITDKLGTFRPDMTIYLRNENGPFWVETSTK